MFFVLVFCFVLSLAFVSLQHFVGHLILFSKRIFYALCVHRRKKKTIWNIGKQSDNGCIVKWSGVRLNEIHSKRNNKKRICSVRADFEATPICCQSTRKKKKICWKWNQTSVYVLSCMSTTQLSCSLFHLITSFLLAAFGLNFFGVCALFFDIVSSQFRYVSFVNFVIRSLFAFRLRWHSLLLMKFDQNGIHVLFYRLPLIS